MLQKQSQTNACLADTLVAKNWLCLNKDKLIKTFFFVFYYFLHTLPLLLATKRLGSFNKDNEHPGTR